MRLKAGPRIWSEDAANGRGVRRLFEAPKRLNSSSKIPASLKRQSPLGIHRREAIAAVGLSMLCDVFSSERNPGDVVADKASNLKEGVEMAGVSIDSGAARGKIEALKRLTNQ